MDNGQQYTTSLFSATAKHYIIELTLNNTQVNFRSRDFGRGLTLARAA